MSNKLVNNNIIKAGESRGRAPGQASDYALRAPNPLDSSAMTRCFIKILGPPNQSGPQVFCPPAPPLAGLEHNTRVFFFDFRLWISICASFGIVITLCINL